MPNRIIREGILTSKRMATLINTESWFGEVFYRRLHQIVDDFGRYSADPELLRPSLFPRQLDRVREADITRLLAASEQAGLVRLYSVKGESYLEVTDFNQQTRAKRSKFPAPPSAVQMLSTCVADDAHMHTDTDTESYAETESETETESDECGTASDDAPPQQEEAVEVFPIVGTGGPNWVLTRGFFNELQGLYTTIDVKFESGRALQWIKAHMDRRKTAKGMRQFLNTWMNKATEEKARRPQQSQQRQTLDDRTSSIVEDVLKGRNGN